jgi:hypothetical protein
MKINNIEYQLSEKKNKKLKAYVNEKWVHFGQKGYDHYRDATYLLPKSQNHLDEKRRENYLKRALKITDKEGNLTAKDINSANYHAIKILWNYDGKKTI